jgi:hypothetical protein
MVNSRFIDERFDTNNCQNYILSVQCSLNGVSFVVFDPVTNKFNVLLEHFFISVTPYELKNELDILFKNEPILNYPFRNVKASFLNQRSVMVPDPIIGEHDREALFYNTFDKKRDELLLRNEVVTNSTSLLFSVPGVVYRCIKAQFPDVDFFATPLPVINYGMKQKSLSPKFLISKFNDLLLVCLVSDRKIHFLNHFYIKNDIDCLYYVLSVAKKLNVNPKTELILFGRIEIQSDLAISLRNYFEKIEFARIRDHHSVSASFPDLPEHFRVPLYELTLCE